MVSTTSLVFAGIAPHPPIMVPEVGRGAIAEVRKSIDGMADLTRRIIESQAETVVLISPHAPLEASAFVAYDGPQLYGDFANFRAPTATAHAKLDEEVVEAIRTCQVSRIVDIDQELRRTAGECGYRSMLVAFGVIDDARSKCDVISYEAPFGVGYLVAQLLSEPPAVACGPASERA